MPLNFPKPPNPMEQFQLLMMLRNQKYQQEREQKLDAQREHDREQDIVRQGVQWRAQGMSMKEIVSALNPTARGMQFLTAFDKNMTAKENYDSTIRDLANHAKLMGPSVSATGSLVGPSSQDQQAFQGAILAHQAAERAPGMDPSKIGQGLGAIGTGMRLDARATQQKLADESRALAQGRESAAIQQLRADRLARDAEQRSIPLAGETAAARTAGTLQAQDENQAIKDVGSTYSDIYANYKNGVLGIAGEAELASARKSVIVEMERLGWNPVRQQTYFNLLDSKAAGLAEQWKRAVALSPGELDRQRLENAFFEMNEEGAFAIPITPGVVPWYERAPAGSGSGVLK